MSSISLTGFVSKPEKNGQLQKDDKGYYNVNLGGFNIFNHKGEFYRVKNLNAILNNTNSVFYKRLTGGYLNGEAEHPIMTPGMSNSEFYYRNLAIRLENTSHHIRNDLEVIELNEKNNIPEAGKPVRIRGWIKPSGKHGAALQSFLDNPEQNAAFSIRCITTPPKNIGGYIVKDVIEIITWDWVDLPGIFAANKWSTIAKEAYGTFNMDIDVNEIIIDQFSASNVVACENEDVRNTHKHIMEYIQTESQMKDLNKNPLFNW